MKFPPEIPVTQMAKETIKSMLNKNPEERISLLEFMETPYYSIEDGELEYHIA